MDVYGGYSTSQTTFGIIRADTATSIPKFTSEETKCRAYFSDGEHWIEEWLAW